MALKPFDEADLYPETVKADLGWAGLLLMIASGAAVVHALVAIFSFAFGVN